MSQMTEALFLYLGRLGAPRSATSLFVERDVLVVAQPHEGKPTPAERKLGDSCGSVRSCWLRGILGSIEGPNPWNEEWPRLRSQPLCRAVVRGGPQSGKSFLLQMLAWRLVSQPPPAEQAPVPVVVRLADLVVPGEPVLTEQQIRRGLEETLRRQEVPAKLARHLADNVHQHWFWLLIDTGGAPDDPKDLGRVLQAIRSWDCRLIAALQPSVTDHWSLLTAEFWLAPLNPARVGHFLDCWFAGSQRCETIRAILLEKLFQPEFQPFLASPFWLEKLCAALEQRGFLDRLLGEQLTSTELIHLLSGGADIPVCLKHDRPRHFPSGRRPNWNEVRSLLSGWLEPAAEETVLWQMLEPDLAEQLIQLGSDPEETIRLNVVRILRRLEGHGLAPAEASVVLRRLAEDEDARVCHEALLALLQQGPQSLTPAVMSRLRQLLRAYSGNQRLLLLDGITRENPRTAERFYSLLMSELLADGNLGVRLRAARFLARRVPDEDQWARCLPTLLRDQSVVVRRIGLDLLRRFRASYIDDRILEALFDLLARRDQQGAWEEGLNLVRQRILPRQKQSVRFLLGAMLSGSAADRLSLLEVCRRLGAALFEDGPGQRTGSTGNALLELLVPLLQEPDAEVRRPTARILLDFAHHGKETRLLRRLGDRVADEDKGVRELALASLKRLQE